MDYYERGGRATVVVFQEAGLEAAARMPFIEQVLYRAELTRYASGRSNLTLLRAQMLRFALARPALEGALNQDTPHSGPNRWSDYFYPFGLLGAALSADLLPPGDPDAELVLRDLTRAPGASDPAALRAAGVLYARRWTGRPYDTAALLRVLERAAARLPR